RERQANGGGPDDLVTRWLALGPDLRSKQELIRRRAASGHNRRYEFQESLTASLHLTSRRSIAAGVSGGRRARFRLAAVSQNPTLAIVDEHVTDVGIPEGSPHRCLQELRVLAERPELARVPQVRSQCSAPLLELSCHQPSMLADVHPSLEDEKGHDDRND